MRLHPGTVPRGFALEFARISEEDDDYNAYHLFSTFTVQISSRHPYSNTVKVDKNYYSLIPEGEPGLRESSLTKSHLVNSWQRLDLSQGIPAS